MPVSLPIAVNVPAGGVVFAESVHARDFQMNPRRDAFHKILYVQRGRVELHLPNVQMQPATAGTVLTVPAGREHRIEDNTPSVILLLCLGAAWLTHAEGLAGLWDHLEAARALALGGTVAAAWERTWRQALLEQDRRRPGSGVLRDALAMQLLVTLTRQPPPGPGDPSAERLRLVTREMAETFFDRWTIDEAAKRAGLSRRHFTQCFRRLNGKTFVKTLNEHRLDQVERLLRSGQHSVTGAVFSSGFEDLAHFYRLFKQRHGQAPGGWLASATSGADEPVVQ